MRQGELDDLGNAGLRLLDAAEQYLALPKWRKRERREAEVLLREAMLAVDLAYLGWKVDRGIPLGDRRSEVRAWR